MLPLFKEAPQKGPPLFKLQEVIIIVTNNKTVTWFRVIRKQPKEYVK